MAKPNKSGKAPVHKTYTMPHMTRKDLVKALTDNYTIHAKDADAIVALVFSTISATLLGGGDVVIRDFGHFKTKTVKAHNARNPKTKATVAVPAKKSAKWTPAKKLKRAA